MTNERTVQAFPGHPVYGRAALVLRLVIGIAACFGWPAVSPAQSPLEAGQRNVSFCAPMMSRPSLDSWPACTPTPPRSSWGIPQYVFLSADGGSIPSTAKKDARVKKGAGLVYRRADSSSAPPACASQPCFSYQDRATESDGLGPANTCYAASADVRLRGYSAAANLSQMIADLKKEASTVRPDGAPPQMVLYMRWDLLFWPELQIDGFDPAWLARSYTPWAAFQAFVTKDHSTFCSAGANAACKSPGQPLTCCTGAETGTCTAACSWTWSDRGYSDQWDGKDVGLRYNDLIAVRGGDPERAIYYLTRPNYQKLSPDGVVVRQDDPAYQDWRIGLVKKMLAESGADMVLLNDKFFQYGAESTPSSSKSFYAGDQYSDMTSFLGRSGMSSGGAFTGRQISKSSCNATHPILGVCDPACNDPTQGYTLGTYIHGLSRLATKLRAEGIKYAFVLGGYTFNSTTLYDDCETPENENTMIREIALGASLVWLSIDRGNHASCEKGAAATKAALDAANVPFFYSFETDTSTPCNHVTDGGTVSLCR
jgi:hypothetical protein